MKTRLSENRRPVKTGNPNNGIAVHVMETGHQIAWKQASVLEREAICYRRRIKEALQILKSTEHKLNLTRALTQQQLDTEFQKQFPVT